MTDTLTVLPLTVAELRRRITPGAVFDVTNHYITRPDHSCFGTKRREIISTKTRGFYLSLDGLDGQRHPEGSYLDWPRAGHVGQTDDGALLIFGGPSTDTESWTIQIDSRNLRYHIAPDGWEPGPWSPDGIGTNVLCGALDPATRHVGNVQKRGSTHERYVCPRCAELSGDPRGGLLLTLRPVTS